MKNLANVSVLLSTVFALALPTLAGCAADATGDQGATQDPLGGVDSVIGAKTPCSTFDGSKQKCEAQARCDYDAVKSACIEAPSAPAPTPAPQPGSDPCTQAFGKDEKACATKAPTCAFDKGQGVCVLAGSQPGGTTVSKCGSYTDPNSCISDASCTFDRAKMVCIDASSTTVGSSATTAVDAYCGQLPQQKCAAEPRCIFDAAKQVCRGR